MRRLLPILVAAVALICALVPPPDASANATAETQSAPAEHDPPAPTVSPGDELVLARICVSEAGWEPGTECAAIHEVLADRAELMALSFRSAACAYSTRTCTTSRTDARRWIANLRRDGRRPSGWPAGTSWTRHQPLWSDVLELAGDVLRGDVESPCAGGVHHWGAPYGEDLARARRYGWERVDCPGAHNAFWRVPSRAPR